MYCLALNARHRGPCTVILTMRTQRLNDEHDVGAKKARSKINNGKLPYCFIILQGPTPLCYELFKLQLH